MDILPLTGTVTASCNGEVIASSKRAKVMYETRLPPTVYFPLEDVSADLVKETDLQSFCPFKGTADYLSLRVGEQSFQNAVWTYANALPESRDIEGYVAFAPDVLSGIDLGENVLREATATHATGPLVDWLLRDAATCSSPEELTRAFAHKLIENGVVLSRISIMIWSLHPLIAGKNYVWARDTDTVSTYAPSYEIHDHPAFVNSPLRHVSNGLGGVRQKLGEDYAENSFPIMEDLRAEGATDYVAMPLPFSDGRRNVMTLTCDHPDGFTTANLGLVFECSSVVSRYFEVFTQKENARSLLETYVGRRTGARVLGGEIRRGDGDDIDAAIMFCDLRGSTRLEEALGRKAYIQVLNSFFETASGIVEDNNGEVLKFIGDAVLAVFPAGDDPDAARRHALSTSVQIVKKLEELEPHGEGLKCDCAIGVAFGRVTFGNVGSRERLDFTVIGQPANVAARLGDFGKITGHRIVVSGDIVLPEYTATELGKLTLHNIAEPVQSYAISA